jgi:hypothetical protein
MRPLLCYGICCANKISLALTSVPTMEKDNKVSRTMMRYGSDIVRGNSEIFIFWTNTYMTTIQICFFCTFIRAGRFLLFLLLSFERDQMEGSIVAFYSSRVNFSVHTYCPLCSASLRFAPLRGVDVVSRLALSRAVGPPSPPVVASLSALISST